MSSCVSEPCKLNPCPSVCYLHVLTKAQGKGTWAFPKKLAKALDNYLAKEGCLEDPFSKQTLRNYQPCVSTPRTPEQNKEGVNKNTLSITKFAHDLYPATYEEHPIQTQPLPTVCFRHLLTKRHSKGARAWHKVFSLNPFY